MTLLYCLSHNFFISEMGTFIPALKISLSERYVHKAFSEYLTNSRPPPKNLLFTQQGTAVSTFGLGHLLEHSRYTVSGGGTLVHQRYRYHFQGGDSSPKLFYFSQSLYQVLSP